MNAIHHSASTRTKIENGLKHLDSLEAAGFQVVGYHLAGEKPTFTVVPMAEPVQPLDYADGGSDEA